MFYGRKKELNILEKRFNSEKFEFGFLYGQRRIGKTSLIDEFKKNHKTLLFFASDSDDVSTRIDFSEAFFRQTNQLGMSSFTSWQSFFEAIESYFKNDNGLVVFDEYPNIVQTHDGKRKRTDFDSKLQDAIDHIFKDTKITIIIMGSNVSFMENIIKDKSGPLYKRHTFSLLLSKLEWPDALEFVKGMNINDQIKILSLTDTYPFYLSHIDPTKSFDENLDYLFFNMDSLIAMDPTSAITSSVSITGFYLGIMRCIANDINTIKNIGIALNAESGKVSLYINELLKSGAIRKRIVFNSERKTYYEINDRVTAFYFRFISPYIEWIKLGQGQNIKEWQSESINSFVCTSYEKVCMTYLEYLNANNRLESFYLNFSNFVADNTSLGRSVEIDIIAADGKQLLIGECKFSKNKKGIKEYKNMQEDGTIKPLSSYPNKCYYLFSHSGFDSKLIDLNDKNLHLISSQDMLSNKFK